LDIAAEIIVPGEWRHKNHRFWARLRTLWGRREKARRGGMAASSQRASSAGLGSHALRGAAHGGRGAPGDTSVDSSPYSSWRFSRGTDLFWPLWSMRNSGQDDNEMSAPKRWLKCACAQGKVAIASSDFKLKQRLFFERIDGFHCYLSYCLESISIYSPNRLQWHLLPVFIFFKASQFFNFFCYFFFNWFWIKFWINWISKLKIKLELIFIFLR